MSINIISSPFYLLDFPKNLLYSSVCYFLYLIGGKMNQCKQCGHELPEPLPAFCTFCGAPTSPSSETVIPMGAVSSESVPHYYCPWEDRARLGFWKGFWETVKAIFSQPVEFFQRISPTGNLGSALGFGVLTGSVGMVMSIFWQIVMHMLQTTIMFSFLPHNNAFPAIIGQTFFILWIIGFAVTSPLWVLIGIFIWSAIIHFFLWIVGGAQKGFESTVRTICYSHAVMIIMIVPICGGWVAGIWSLVLRIIGLKELHQTSYGKSIAANLLPMVLCCCCVAIGMVILFMVIGVSMNNPDQIKQFLQKLGSP